MCPADGPFPPPPVTARLSLTELRRAAQECRACALRGGATKAMSREGRRDSRLMLVGEQPGGREDIERHPFVGPAGRVLDRGLQRAGIEHKDVYVTNVVEHLHSPSSILRIRDEPARHSAIEEFVADLERVARWLDHR